MFKIHNYKQLLNSTGAAALTDHIILFSPCFNAAHCFQNNGVLSFLFHKLTKWEGETYRAGHFLLESQSFEAYESTGLVSLLRNTQTGALHGTCWACPKGLKKHFKKQIQQGMQQ